MARFYYIAALISVFAVNNGNALKCWSCSSDIDSSCADYFNITAFARVYTRYDTSPRTPLLEDCEIQRSPYPPNQKSVCIKKKQTAYGKTSYIRQCHYLQPNEQVGTCPSETLPYVKVEFCEYCDFDGCNGATRLRRMLWSVFAPVALLLFLQK